MLTTYYLESLQAGLNFQDHVADWILKEIKIPLTIYSSINRQKEEESAQGIEIKLDRKYSQTGNLYIEYEERCNPESQWHPSGINRQDWLLIIGDYQKIWLLSTKHLRIIKQRGNCKLVETETSKGFLLSVKLADFWAVRSLEVASP